MGTATMDIATANVVNASVSDTADIRRYKTVAPTVTKTANYTTTELDDVILVDATGGARTITLHASPDNGKVLTIKKIDSSANAVTVDADAANLIDGFATVILRSQWESIQIIAGNANEWHIESRSGGKEIYYEEKTTTTAIVGTTEATATTIIAGAAVGYNGEAVIIEFSAPRVDRGTLAASEVHFWLYEDGSSIGELGEVNSNNADSYGDGKPVHLSRRMSPSAGSHTYSIRAHRITADGSVLAGAGGAATKMPAFLSITRARA